MLDIQTTDSGSAVSQSNEETTISAILSYVLSDALPSKPPVVDMDTLSVCNAAHYVTLLPGEPETAAAYAWTRAGTSSKDPDAQAVEIEEALAALKLLETRNLPEDLADKVWEDQHVLRTRALRVYRMQWDIRFKSERWGRKRIEKTLDQERARLWWAYTREIDNELKYLLRKQIEWFTVQEQEALAL